MSQESGDGVALPLTLLLTVVGLTLNGGPLIRCGLFANYVDTIISSVTYDITIVFDTRYSILALQVYSLYKLKQLHSE